MRQRQGPRGFTWKWSGHLTHFSKECFLTSQTFDWFLIFIIRPHPFVLTGLFLLKVAEEQNFATVLLQLWLTKVLSYDLAETKFSIFPSIWFVFVSCELFWFAITRLVENNVWNGERKWRSRFHWSLERWLFGDDFLAFWILRWKNTSGKRYVTLNNNYNPLVVRLLVTSKHGVLKNY